MIELVPRNVVPLSLLALLACTSGSPAGGAVDAPGGTAGRPDGPRGCPEDLASCTCPGEPCTRWGCVDGVAYGCDNSGDCIIQAPGVDCVARGETCWVTTDEWGSSVAGCRPPGCGDGVVQAGEACDEGPDNGTRLDACTSACTAPPPATLDQRHLDGATEPLRYVQRDHAAFQTFRPTRSGRLAWIVADVRYGGLFLLGEEGHQLLAPSTQVQRRVDGRHRTEHHFLEPVRVEAGREYAFGLQCGDWQGCDLQVTRGDVYPEGAVVFRAYPGDAEPAPAPADADLPFETWILEGDDGCAPADAPRCYDSCESPNLVNRPTCIAGVWDCGEGFVDYEATCIPRHDGPLALAAEVGAEIPGEVLAIDRGEYEPWIVLRPGAALELARLELPETVFDDGYADARLFRGEPTDRPVQLVAMTEGHRPASTAGLVFDFVPPVPLEAGATYCLAPDGASALPYVSSPDGWTSLQLVPWVGHVAPELPVGATVPLRIWRTAE